MMQEIRFRLELEGLRNNIQAYLSNQSQLLNEKIETYLKEVMTQEWVENEIEVAVTNAVHNAIKDIANDSKLQTIIKDIILEKYIKETK